MNNIYSVIKRGAEASGCAGVALSEGGYDLTYDALFKRVEVVAGQLKSFGVSDIGRVVLYCGDCIDYVVASLAILSVGGVVIPVPVSSSARELAEVIERVRAESILFDVALRECDGDAFTAGSFLTKRLQFSPLSNGCVVEDMDNPAFIRFSSGTTGQSKGVLLTHKAIIERTDLANAGLKITKNDVVLWSLSMSYHFVVSILLFLRCGATIRLCYADFPLALQQALSEGSGSFIYASPFHYDTMVKSRNFDPACMGGVRMAVCTAMKLTRQLADSFKAKFGFDLTEAYGIIEVGLPCISRAGQSASGSVGRLLPGYEMKLLDSDEAGIGEVCLRGAGMYSAYVSPYEIRERDAWFYTGDLGWAVIILNYLIFWQRDNPIKNSKVLRNLLVRS